ncbi:MAG: alpha-amylase, partial [Spirochaetaceae bacterium]|nr:alpha-amylase [Spirochaetaceae bacterium]
IPRLLELGVNALYLGPLFESTAHGYDTLDYFHVDRRLGNNAGLKALTAELHRNGIMAVLDGVFNHTGRHFFAFRDLAEKGRASAYGSWFSGLDFNRRSPLGDPFTYDTWAGAFDLVKLNGHNREVRNHLFEALRFWVEEFDIDGLRLDAADQLLPDFMDELSAFAGTLKQDFWLLGEVVAGDYSGWARPGRLDSVTNYELYKGLWSCLKDRNFFELAWTLNRQFGDEGLYRGQALYNFVDNHDVDRAASVLDNPAHLFPLYGLLFTVPGIPSIYYGSEYGIRGRRSKTDDSALRPAWAWPPEHYPDDISPAVDPASLSGAIARFAALRKSRAALREGSYRELFKGHGQFAFLREIPPGGEGPERGAKLVIAVNADGREEGLRLPGMGQGRWRDILNGGEYTVSGGTLEMTIPPAWLRILEPADAG